MNKMTRIALLTASLIGFTGVAQAANTEVAPAPSQDPIVQHLKLTNDQVAKIQSLHDEMEKSVEQVSMKDVKDGALIDVIHSGKWDEQAVKTQLEAFSKVEQQTRYYRVKYYFDLNQVLTPAQRKQIQDDLIQSINN
ncbi:Spy/CpxP family protein refolding chaperone [Scandinavium sp. H11S7]|uniref:Spy/CpxP family protein refolding chaperone n=1 Tax=Scandinavium hiltneri TaxID=2926519 RepID=A0ABT2E0Z8_9ENTR|nr:MULTISPECIES: Spy/CpxP family protein refolding chaperone [Scandinavium]MCS2148499.1 Spy/CpxP family protein refolding chaperone [Scandinavium manionii]MCS2156292.1 Spy/CpxP family protein refolding chaperone [Scandinavium hiltneri]MCS2161098.1 Spy/CpxP family protein refolding chaperone [Scandinavium hiltneri]